MSATTNTSVNPGVPWDDRGVHGLGRGVRVLLFSLRRDV